MARLSALLRWGHNRHYSRGMLHFNRGEYESAASEFEVALAEVRDPGDPDYSLARCFAAEARGHLGLACFHAGQYARAEQHFTRALEESPSFPDLRYYRARIRERSGRAAEAVTDLEQALVDQPRYLEAFLLLAVCRAQLHDRPGAIAALEQALALGFVLPDGLAAAAAPGWGATEWAR